MPNCYLRLTEIVNTLPNSERRVANYILDSPHETVSMSIDELAKNCDTSKSSVVRLCKSLGYTGFKEFCRVLNAEISSASPESVLYKDILPQDDLHTVAKHVCANNIKSIENSLSILDYEALAKAVSAISKAARVDFYGVGNSGFVAMDAQIKFTRINKLSVAHVDSHLQIISASTLTKNDVAVLISYSGETRDILETMRVIRQTGATIIGITKYGKSTVSDNADINLYTASLETLFRSGAMSSRIGQLNLIDILFTAIASKDYADVQEYLNRSTSATRKKKTGRFEG